MQKAEKSEEFLQAQRLAAERHEAERRAAEASVAAQHAANPVLAALVAIPPRQAGKMKLEELRVACRMRQLSDIGVRKVLSERLAAYVHQSQVDPPVVHMPSEQAFGAQALLLGGAGSSPDAIEARAFSGVVLLLKRVKASLQDYKSQVVAPLEKSPLEWWAEKHSVFPHLASLARDLLGSPGSTAALARCFSNAGRVWTERRARLDARLGSDILMCHENIIRGHF